MRNFTPLRMLGAATFLSVSALAALAQSAPPAPSAPPAEKPPMVKPEPTPVPQSAPTPAPDRPVTAPKSSAAPSAQPLLGLSAFSADGSKIGDVRAVKTAPDGKITAIHVKSGGFLGFGGRIVEVVEGKFTQRGENVQLGYTADELSKLPEVKDGG